MEIKKILIIIFIILLLILTGFFLLKMRDITGKAIEEVNNLDTKKETYTKAICNSTNYCRDYQVSCSGAKVLEAIPIGEGIQFNETWQDTRENPQQLCPIW